MSRVSNNPISIPSSVEISITSSEISIKGPLGNLKQIIARDISLELSDNTLKIKTANDSKHANAMSGTTRALIANMVRGVSVGFEKNYY